MKRRGGAGVLCGQAFLDTQNNHDLGAFRALYVDSGYVQHQTLVTNPGRRLLARTGQPSISANGSRHFLI